MPLNKNIAIFTLVAQKQLSIPIANGMDYRTSVLRLHFLFLRHRPRTSLRRTPARQSLHVGGRWLRRSLPRRPTASVADILHMPKHTIHTRSKTQSWHGIMPGTIQRSIKPSRHNPRRSQRLNPRTQQTQHLHEHRPPSPMLHQIHSRLKCK